MSTTEFHAIAGHPYMLRMMGGELIIALDYGPGKCSSFFQSVAAMHGPAIPFGLR